MEVTRSHAHMLFKRECELLLWCVGGVTLSSIVVMRWRSYFVSYCCGALEELLCQLLLWCVVHVLGRFHPSQLINDHAGLIQLS
eukprot:scaffold2549_cov177-Ochromonas_danica.AAC.2